MSFQLEKFLVLCNKVVKISCNAEGASEKVIKRIESADNEKAEGQKICVELLEQFKEIDGIHGAHLMGPRQEQSIADLVSKAGLGV